MMKLKYFLYIILWCNSIGLFLLSIKHIELLDNPVTDTIILHDTITYSDSMDDGCFYNSEFLPGAVASK